jgi:hypothetical protein
MARFPRLDNPSILPNQKLVDTYFRSFFHKKSLEVLEYWLAALYDAKAPLNLCFCVCAKVNCKNAGGALFPGKSKN